ncbi:telomere resolvase [Candidatus Synechococcus calcipolaris G9]|uniref:Telomere resolvase n=1 Tax=Candidatus Synechococcus calcipolaris G9 TaxID=1497997 RepID=A0ABT6EUJ9_9SYNE|nr:protelomerase family protein [Candidatus Synechococcus calcipolaris]MDG2989537.1 telomere resolvase [Candidatus Synechococcus calcipolaris G9]
MDWLETWGQTRKPPPWAVKLINEALVELEGLTRADDGKMLALRDRLTDAMLQRVSPSSVKNYFTMLHRAIRFHFSPESGRLNPENSYQRSDQRLDPIACLLVDVPIEIKRKNRADQDAALEKILNNPSPDLVLTDPDGIVQRGREILEGAIAAYGDPDQSCFYLDIAASLSLVTGLRPVEVLRDAVLESGHSQYTVRLVAGQAKTRGNERIYEMPTLVEGRVVLKGFQILRTLHDFSDYSTDNMIQTEQNKLRDRVVDLFTGVVPIPTPQHLRAVYDAIAYFWFCPPGVKEPAFIRAINGHTPLAGKVGAALNYLKYEIGQEAIQRYGGAKGVRLSEPGIEVIEAFRIPGTVDGVEPVGQTADADVAEVEPIPQPAKEPAIPRSRKGNPKMNKTRNAILSRSARLLSGTWVQRAIALQVLTGLSLDRLLHGNIEPHGLYGLLVDEEIVTTLIQQLMPSISKFRQLPPENGADMQGACNLAFGDLIQVDANNLSLLYLACAPSKTDQVDIDFSVPKGMTKTDQTLSGNGDIGKDGKDDLKRATTSPQDQTAAAHPSPSNHVPNSQRPSEGEKQQNGAEIGMVALAKAVEMIHSLNTQVKGLESHILEMQAEQKRLIGRLEAQAPPEFPDMNALELENERLRVEVAQLRSTLDNPQELLNIIARLMNRGSTQDNLSESSETDEKPESSEREEIKEQNQDGVEFERTQEANTDEKANGANSPSSIIDPDVVRAFDVVMAYNDAPGRSHGEKWVMSYPVMKDLLATIGKNSQRKITPVMNARQDDLDEHYRKHGLSPRHNGVHTKNNHRITDYICLTD